MSNRKSASRGKSGKSGGARRAGAKKKNAAAARASGAGGGVVSGAALRKGQALMRARKRLGMNQKQGAEFLGVPVSSLCRWERGERMARNGKADDLLAKYEWKK